MTQTEKVQFTPLEVIRSYVAEGMPEFDAAYEQICKSHAQMYEALIQADLQIEYMQSKFKETGTGNSVRAQIQRAIAAAEGKDWEAFTLPDRLEEAHEALESAKKYLSTEWYPDWSVIAPLHILNDAQIAIEKELASLKREAV